MQRTFYSAIVQRSESFHNSVSASPSLKMTDSGFSKYKTFLLAHRVANPQIMNKEEQTRIAQALWNPIKKDPVKQQQMILTFKSKAASKKSKLMAFWSKAQQPSATIPKPAPVEVPQPPVSQIAPKETPDPPNTSSKGNHIVTNVQCSHNPFYANRF